MSVIRFFKYMLPHWVFVLVQRRRQMLRDKDLSGYQRRHDLARVDFEREQSTQRTETYSFEAAVSHLMELGISEDHIRWGSIPENHLDFITSTVQTNFGGTPIVGVHIGNFLGISLCHLANYLKKENPESCLIAIDPNLNHRGIDRCNDVAMELVHRYGLDHQVINTVGYSMWKSMSNDGIDYAGTYDPERHFQSEQAPEYQLANLSKLMSGRVDFILLDGNHNHKYLQKEIEEASRLLKPKGLVILDDVHESWSTIKETFEHLADSSRFRKLGYDGRVGILEFS